MCEPTTIMMAAGLAISAYGMYQQGEQADAWSKYEQKQANADAAAEAGMARVEAQRIRDRAKADRSRAIAALAASGVDLNSDTALKIDQDITRRSAEDAYLSILGGEDRSARRVQEGVASRISGRQARNASRINAAGTLLKAGNKVASGWRTGGTTKGVNNIKGGP